MRYGWIYNDKLGRAELWAVDDATGAARIVAVHAVRGSSYNDLGPDVQVTPFSDEMTPLVWGAANGDTSAIARMNEATGVLNDTSRRQGLNIIFPASGQGGNAGADMRTVREDPADTMALTRLVNSALDARTAQSVIDQTRTTLEQQMRQRGQDPAWWFQTYSGQSADTGAAMPPMDSITATGVRPSPDQMDAWRGQAEAAMKAARIRQAEQVQRVANAWSAHVVGADRLQKLQDTTQARDRMTAQLELDEQRLRANPGNDRHLTPRVGGAWGYSQTGGARDAIDDKQAEIDAMQRDWWPEQWMEEQRRKQRERAAAGGAVHWSWLQDQQQPQTYAGGGMVADPFMAAAGTARTYLSRYQQSPALPRFAEGGETQSFYYQTPSASFGSGAGGYTPMVGGQYDGTYGPPQGANSTQQDQDAYRKQAFAGELEQRDVSEQLARIEQEAAFRTQQLQQAHAQRMAALQQRYTVLNTELQRQRAGLQQEVAWSNAEYGLMPLPGRGQTWAG